MQPEEKKRLKIATDVVTDLFTSAELNNPHQLMFAAVWADFEKLKTCKV